MDEKIESLEEMQVDLPFLGKQKIADIKKYIPLYMRLRKDPDIKGLIPRDIDKYIVTFAENEGIIEKKIKPLRLDEVDIPVRDLNENIDLMLDEGWSTTQIARQLNIYPMIVSDRDRANQEELEAIEESARIYTWRYRIVSWLKQRLRL